MADYSDSERDTVRSAAFGAMLLVSKADPGCYMTLKESMARSKVLARHTQASGNADWRDAEPAEG